MKTIRPAPLLHPRDYYTVYSDTAQQQIFDLIKLYKLKFNLTKIQLNQIVYKLHVYNVSESMNTLITIYLSEYSINETVFEQLYQDWLED